METLEGPRLHRQSFARPLGVPELVILNVCLLSNRLSLVLRGCGRCQLQALLQFCPTQAFLTRLD